MGLFSLLLLIFSLLTSPAVCLLKEFISIDCGGTSNYTDKNTGLTWISDYGIMNYGTPVEVEGANGNRAQYQRRRDFPIDNKKYCYTLITEERRRYLVRATFQYGSLKSGDTYPQFQLFLDATKWATVSIYDASRVYVEEMIIRAPSSSIDVCICCASTGSPFISTLELRPLNLSMYATDFEDNFFLKVAVKVMQTAVVGTKGVLSYRLNLEDFPANARAYAYFAEIEDLGKNETRKFKLELPYIPDYSNAVVNIAENANGSYTLYEPSYMNVSLDFVLSFSFHKTRDSTQGPLLNAMEISKYQPIASKTDRQDSNVINAFRSMSAESVQKNEGDPCVPTPWEWVNCSATTSSLIVKSQMQVALLSRIHHRNLVPLIGYCEEEYQCILVYEFMHNGTLRDHIHGSAKQKNLDWPARLRIAEDAAKGLEYLHTGCNPSIIHRDVKTSNILLDINMRAKVSDFGLSRLAEEDLTHISSIARGTVGYLDPEYYANQQLTEKSDVYSFGVVLLELISGRKPVSSEDYGAEMNIVHWARSLIRKGDVMSIMDPTLVGNVKIESIWRVAEIAIQCVEQHGVCRPRMQEIILAIQEAVKIEKGTDNNNNNNKLKLSSSSSSKAQSSRKTLLTSFLEIESPDLSNGYLPSAR